MSYYYPFYRSPYAFYPPYYPGNYYNSNIIGSAVANQNQTQIGTGNVGTQIANPISIW
jgi:hypothetical protein